MAAAIGIAKTATEIFLGVGEVSIDNFTFKLFYKWSVTMLIVCSVLVSTSQFFGDPIQCETADDSVDDDVLNSFCWMYSSFDMPSNYKGVCSRKKMDSTQLYNTYYQWVSIFLGTQAVLFYIPRCIWLSHEGGLMAHLVKGTTGRVVEDADDKQGNLLKNFQIHIHNKFGTYAACFFMCEAFNLVVVMIAVYLTHKFLNDQFLSYGLDIYRYFSLPPEERLRMNVVNPFCEVFPKVASCHFHRYGMGGKSDDRFGICILGLNMINDKVFAIIWCWHWILILMGCLRLMTRSSQLMSSRIRYFLIKLKMRQFFGKNNHHLRHIQHYILNCSIGDWFVLYQMSKNLNKRFFAEFLALIAMTVNPDPNIVPEEPEIFLSDAYIDKVNRFLKKDVSVSVSVEDGEEDGQNKTKDKDGKNFFSNMEGELDTTLETEGPGGGLSGKQRMLIKNGKGAISAKAKANYAMAQVRRLKRRA